MYSFVKRFLYSVSCLRCSSAALNIMEPSGRQREQTSAKNKLLLRKAAAKDVKENTIYTTMADQFNSF